MSQDHQTGTDATRAASILGPLDRAAAFTAFRPALEILVTGADADLRLSADARRTLRAVARTRPEGKLALADLAARGSTPKTRVPAALQELEDHGYLARLAHIAPHLAAALPATTPPGPARIRAVGGGRVGEAQGPWHPPGSPART